MTDSIVYRARISFLGKRLDLLETGRLTAAWAEHAASLLAPELTWSSAVVEHADYGNIENWQASHVVRLNGVRLQGGALGRGESTLRAGGHGSAVGGTGRVRIEALAPYRSLEVNNHCDVTHWDFDVGPIAGSALEAMVLALEERVGVTPKSAVKDRLVVSRKPETIGSDALASELEVWLEDLQAAAIEARIEGGALIASSSNITTFTQLEAARIALGEVLAEAGHDDWDADATALLRQLPHSE